MNHFNYWFRKSGRLFWTKVVCVGYQYDKEYDKETIFLKDGSQISIANWKSYDSKVDKTFVAFQKARAEREIGQTVPVKNPPEA